MDGPLLWRGEVVDTMHATRHHQGWVEKAIWDQVMSEPEMHQYQAHSHRFGLIPHSQRLWQSFEIREGASRSKKCDNVKKKGELKFIYYMIKFLSYNYWTRRRFRLISEVPCLRLTRLEWTIATPPCCLIGDIPVHCRSRYQSTLNSFSNIYVIGTVACLGERWVILLDPDPPILLWELLHLLCIIHLGLFLFLFVSLSTLESTK